MPTNLMGIYSYKSIHKIYIPRVNKIYVWKEGKNGQLHETLVFVCLFDLILYVPSTVFQL